MTAYLLDTNHVSAVLKRHAGMMAKLAASGDAEFGVAMPSIGELWFMVFNSERLRENTVDLRRVIADFVVWEYDDTAAMEFGRIKAELRRLGRPIPDVDVQIAAVARVQDMTLLSADGHFSVVPGLRVENWLV